MSSFADFYTRIDAIAAIVAKADKSLIESRAEETITIGMGPGKSADLTPAGYVNGWLMPNLFFHMTTVYNILRKEGVQLGKMDYLNSYIGGYVDVPAQ